MSAIVDLLAPAGLIFVVPAVRAWARFARGGGARWWWLGTLAAAVALEGGRALVLRWLDTAGARPLWPLAAFVAIIVVAAVVPAWRSLGASALPPRGDRVVRDSALDDRP